MVAASWASVGSATPVSLLPPMATSVAATPKPLNGILILSSLPFVTLASAIFAVVTAFEEIEVTPALVSVTSPVGVTAAARFEPSPMMIFPDVSAEPTGEVPVIVVLVTPVTRPLESTAKTGTEVELP